MNKITLMWTRQMCIKTCGICVQKHVVYVAVVHVHRQRISKRLYMSTTVGCCCVWRKLRIFIERELAKKTINKCVKIVSSKRQYVATSQNQNENVQVNSWTNQIANHKNAIMSFTVYQEHVTLHKIYSLYQSPLRLLECSELLLAAILSSLCL